MIKFLSLLSMLLSFLPGSSSLMLSSLMQKQIYQILRIQKNKSTKEVQNIPKYYSDYCENQPKSYYDYKNYAISFGDISNYNISEDCLGGGSFAKVYLGSDLRTGETIVIKELEPIFLDWIKKEVLVMEALKGAPYIIQLKDVVKYTNETGQEKYGFILEYLDTIQDDWKDYFMTISDNQTRHYMYQALTALDYMNSKGIMHRDLKPQNIMVNKHDGSIKIIDFGFGEFYIPGSHYREDGTLHYMAPEVMLRQKDQQYSVDIWSLGIIFGQLLKKTHLFKGKETQDQMVLIEKMLGTDAYEAYLKKYDIKEESYISDYREGMWYEPQDWATFIGGNVSDDALDLLCKFLVYDPEERITPRDALSHSYFDSVRAFYLE